MPKRLLKNASFNTASQIVNMAVSILFVPVYIHFLGINGYGIYSFLLLFFSWITILHAGVDPAVTKMTAKYVAENNHEHINPLISAAMIFQVIAASVIAGIFVLSSAFLAGFIVKNEVGFLHETRVALYYAGIGIVVLMCRNIYIAFLMGLQRYDISSGYDALFNLLASLFALLALWVGYGIVGIIVVRLIVNIISIAVLHHVSKRLVSSFRFSLNISKDLVREIYNYASWIVAGRINQLAVNALPPILIGKYIGPSGIAYFNISSRIVGTLNNLLSSSLNVMFPFVSELKALKETERVKLAYLGANRFLSLVSAPLYCFGAIYSWELLYFWLGPDIANNCSLLMGLFFIGYYLSSTTMVPSVFALGMGALRVLAVAGAAQIIIILLTLPYLLKTFGIVGAGLNLVLFEVPGIIMVIFITTTIINASNFAFWIRDRLLMLLVSTVIFAAFLPLKVVFWPGEVTRGQMAVFLGCVFVFGVSIYGVIAKTSNLIDQDTKKRIANMFLIKAA